MVEVLGFNRDAGRVYGDKNLSDIVHNNIMFITNYLIGYEASRIDANVIKQPRYVRRTPLASDVQRIR